MAQPDAVYDALFYNYSPDIIIDRIAGIPVVIAPRFKLKYFAKNDDDAVSYALNLSNQLANAGIYHIVLLKTSLSLTATAAGTYRFPSKALLIGNWDSVYPVVVEYIFISPTRLGFTQYLFNISGGFTISLPSGTVPNINYANVQNYFKGNNVAVAAGATSLAVSLSLTLPNTNYAVYVTPQWNTSVWVTGKTTTGFTINFGTAAPTGGSALDWVIFF